MRWLSGLVLVFAMTQFGCATSGQDFPSDVKWIKVSSTKQSDVLTLLGQPQQVGNSSGSPTWTYGYYNFRMMGESKTKELKIYWGPDNTVKNFAFTSSFPEDRRVSGGAAKPAASAPGKEIEPNY